MTILFASQPDCYLVCTDKNSGFIKNEVFLGEDTHGVWRVGEGEHDWIWTELGILGKTFKSRDDAIGFLSQRYEVEIVR